MSRTKSTLPFVLCAVAASSALTLGAVTTVTTAGAAPVTPKSVRTIPSPWFSGHADLYGWGATRLLDGSVLIGDYFNYRVLHFAPDGTRLADFETRTPGPGQPGQGFQPGMHQAPYGMGTDPNDGSVYITDTDRYKVDKYSASGVYLYSFGTQGAGDYQFLYPSRVAVGADGRVYVVDTWANKIKIFRSNDATRSVTQVGQFGAFGSAAGQWKQPHGLDFFRNPADPSQEQLWVTDPGNHRVNVYSREGAFLFTFGGPGDDCTGASAQFFGDMRGLAVDQVNHWVYVVDAAGNRVKKFDAVGLPPTAAVPDATTPCMGTTGIGSAANPAPLGQFTDGGREITVDGESNVWVGDMPNFRVQKFSPTGQALFQWPPPTSPTWAPPAGAFNGPRGVALDKFGNIFVTDTYNQRVEKLNPDGSYNTQWGSRGRDLYAFNYPRMLATDPRDGAVVVADTDNHSIKKYDNNGLFLCGTGGLGKTELGKFRNPHGVDVGADGRIYVTDTRNSRIQVLDQNCVGTKAFGSKGTRPGQMNFPRGIAVDPNDQSIWVADSVRNMVLHFAACPVVDPANQCGRFLGTIGAPGTADNQWKNPFDLEVDANNVYVVDAIVNKIKVWTRTGSFVTAFGGGGKTAGKLLSPNGLDLYNGHLYVAEQDNERIQEFSL